MIWLWGALAMGADPCAALNAPPAHLSVAWVSPVRARARGTIEVVPATQLRDWAHAETRAGVGRLLQRMGMRRRDADPRRRYKVTIFEVPAHALCRPLEGHEAGAVIEGVAVCERGPRTPCGHTTDLGADAPGFDLYRVQWRDAAARGFCVLPATRYLEDVRR